MTRKELESAIETINDELEANSNRDNDFLVKPLFSLGELRALKELYEQSRV